jgi:iron complex transport system ATP-binding protein
LEQSRTILAGKALAVGYEHKKPLLQALNLELKTGQLCCLLGANGTGKSTLLRTISGMHPALGGNIQIDGKPLKHYSGRALSRRLSIVLTERTLTPNLRVEELLSIGRQPHTGWFGRLSIADKEMIAYVMEKTEIVHFAGRYFYELSDGERQKVLIARAMVQDTPLIVLDEPTVHLDLPNQIEIMRMLLSLAHQQNKAILMSTHNLSLALQSADRLWLIRESKIRCGIPEDLVLKGEVEKTFANEHTRFDPFSAAFSMKKTFRAKVRLQAEGLVGHWTRQALERAGLEVSHDEPTVLSVSLQRTKPTPAWIVQNREQSVLCHSLESVVGILRKKSLHLS